MVPGDRNGFAFLQASVQAALAISFGGNVGVLCLSEDPLNLLMWGHYCNAHQGAVVEFDVTHEFFSGSTTEAGFHQYFRKVEYSEQRPSLSHAHFQKNKMGFLNDHGSGWLELLRTEHPLLFTKSPDWAYEREWRLVRQLVDKSDPFSDKPKARKMFTGHHVDDDYARNPVPSPVELAKVPAACIKTIYLGAKSTTYTADMPPFEDEVWNLLSKHHPRHEIRINQVRFDKQRFGLVAFDLQDPEQLRAHVSGQELVGRREGFSAIPLRTTPRPSRRR
jgi:hypothetical protein